jgi:hypothetical protein
MKRECPMLVRTPRRALADPYPVLRFGLETMLQAEPFQCRMSVNAAPLDAGFVPTAQTSVGETAATPNRSLPTATGGLGTTDHRLPFQCSISGWLPVLPLWYPTAHTSDGPVAATALRTFAVGLGLGLLTVSQLVPFHRSISVTYCPLTAVWKPTAQTFDDESATTPFNAFWTPSPPVEKLGLGTIVQLVPFQCSTSVLPW